LGTEAGKQAPFVLAPLNEQKRIADKLDAVLARVDACRDRLDRIPASSNASASPSSPPPLRAS